MQRSGLAKSKSLRFCARQKTGTQYGTQLTKRKRPQQARSRKLVAEILAAAGRVLSREGAQHFTAARVAEEAGISVGSLYQHFPNKAAILFHLQTNEWQQTPALLGDVIADVQKLPHKWLRDLVHAFIRSECEEAAMRVALNDAAPLYCDAPKHKRRGGGRQHFKLPQNRMPPTRCLLERLNILEGNTFESCSISTSKASLISFGKVCHDLAAGN